MKSLIPERMFSYGTLRGLCEFVPSVDIAGRTNATRLVFCLAFVLIAGSSVRLCGQAPAIVDREPEIKAAYLYNFGRYVEWPPKAIAPKEFIIGVVGDSPVVAPLGTIAASKKINGRSVTVRRFRTEKDFKDCNMLYVPAGQDPKVVAGILKAAGKSATLIVGEDANFALQQGHIGFYSSQNNWKFEINNKSAGNAGLKISSKLLSLGRIVGEKPGK